MKFLRMKLFKLVLTLVIFTSLKTYVLLQTELANYYIGSINALSTQETRRKLLLNVLADMPFDWIINFFPVQIIRNQNNGPVLYKYFN